MFGGFCADLESAIEDANKSSEDVTIEVLQDTALPETSIGNENGKKITLDLDGNTVDGGPLTVKAPGVTEITDSSEQGDGSLESNVQVDPGAKLVIDGPANVGGDIKNQGTTENKGYVAGDVENAGDMSNEGVISGEVDNTGDLDNSGRRCSSSRAMSPRQSCLPEAVR